MNSSKCIRVKTPFETGQRLRLFFHPGNINNRNYQVRAVIDNKYLALRWYGKKQWHYGLERIDTFMALLASGDLTIL